MKTIVVKRRFLWLFPYSMEVERPHIRRSKPVAWMTKRYGAIPRCWICEGAGQMGFGETPTDAWNDWANWALA
jgi:hypothetical protein